jgi:hypothetical protein
MSHDILVIRENFPNYVLKIFSYAAACRYNERHFFLFFRVRQVAHVVIVRKWNNIL